MKPKIHTDDDFVQLMKISVVTGILTAQGVDPGEEYGKKLAASIHTAIHRGFKDKNSWSMVEYAGVANELIDHVLVDSSN